MAYSSASIRVFANWAREGLLPRCAARIVEIGSQMIADGTEPEAVAELVRVYRPDFSGEGLQVSRYANEMWKAAGLDYVSLDITEAPDSRVFDLNLSGVPAADLASADIVTNIGTTEHLINQHNAFKVIHDLTKVGGVALHQVPFAGMLNHCLVTYHPKFFYSLVVNNRYKLRYVAYDSPVLHAAFGEGNTVYEGDRPKKDPRVPGSEAWANVSMHSGTITVIVERRHPDPFVPPVDFAGGYFGETTGFDLGSLVGQDIVPHGVWADAFRRNTTPSQKAAS